MNSEWIISLQNYLWNERSYFQSLKRNHVNIYRKQSQANIKGLKKLELLTHVLWKWSEGTSVTGSKPNIAVAVAQKGQVASKNPEPGAAGKTKKQANISEQINWASDSYRLNYKLTHQHIHIDIDIFYRFSPIISSSQRAYLWLSVTPCFENFFLAAGMGNQRVRVSSS